MHGRPRTTAVAGRRPVCRTAAACPFSNSCTTNTAVMRLSCVSANAFILQSGSRPPLPHDRPPPLFFRRRFRCRVHIRFVVWMHGRGKPGSGGGRGDAFFPLLPLRPTHCSVCYDGGTRMTTHVHTQATCCSPMPDVRYRWCGG